ncbi:MAG TPA: hypothetical protein VKT33_10130 [Candidatus Angelobacter sp.]|nr:hypothetical protein [Candidatus Angelobacter sp.]
MRKSPLQLRFMLMFLFTALLIIGATKLLWFHAVDSSPLSVPSLPSSVPSPKKTTHKTHRKTAGIREVVKGDCQHLVDGQLVFTPSTIMRQGQPYIVSARLSRGTDTHITSGLDGKTVIIENTQVSCMVSMKLDSHEPKAFTIDNIPASRKDEQILVANTYTQWDWRVMPVKSGTLHLLLYVAPMLYVDGVGQGLKQVPQPPRVITVSPDRVYAIVHFILEHWAVWSAILSVVIMPFFIWGVKKLKNWSDKKVVAKKIAGFGNR